MLFTEPLMYINNEIQEFEGLIKDILIFFVFKIDFI